MSNIAPRMSREMRAEEAVLCCAVLFFSRPRMTSIEGWPHHGSWMAWTYFLYYICHSDWLFHGES